MRRRTKRAIFGFALGLIVVVVALQLQSKQMVSSRLRAVLLKASDLSPSRVEQLKTERYNAVVLELSDSSDAAKVADRAAADQIHGAGLDLYYWIEIARHAPTADAHPERMASLPPADSTNENAATEQRATPTP